MDHDEILRYEELQHNAFPALRTVMYDGWAIRFGGNFTYRVNDANPMYASTLPVQEKVAYAEELYRGSGLEKAIFKIHEGMAPEDAQLLDSVLEARGYEKDRHGRIQVCPLQDFRLWPNAPQTTIEPFMTDRWLEGFLTMNGTPEDQKAAAKEMLSSIVYPIAAASVWEDGEMIACGLGVLERGYVGLYDIYVDANHRRQGLGQDICSAIMQAGKARGCHTAYLQCLTSNTGARAMYARMGYEETYAYWFRLKRFK